MGDNIKVAHANLLSMKK